MDIINIQSNQKTPNGGPVAGMWSQWNESREILLFLGVVSFLKVFEVCFACFKWNFC